MTPAQPSPRVDILQRAGFWAAALFLFIAYSRILEFVLTGFHIPTLVLALAVVLAVLTGGVQRSLASPAGICLLLLTIWMVVGIPFAVWRGGAAQTVNSWLRAAATYYVIAGLVLTQEQLRSAFSVMAGSISILAVLALIFGSTESGRLMLPWEGKFSNPNDLAAIMLIGLPFWWYLLTNSRARLVTRALALGAIGLLLTILLRTGSRGAMVGVVAIMVVLVIQASGVRRIQIAAASLLIAAVAALLLPASLMERYFTYFDREEAADSDLQTSAVSSAEARSAILIESIRVTLQNPLFGVGAGQFSVAQDALAKERGESRGAWAVTHNSYTQVSSETGIPGLLFYLAALVLSFRALRACKPGPGARTREEEDLGRMAACLQVALLAYAVCSFFMSVAYQMYFPLLAALSMSAASIRRQMLLAPAPAPPPRARAAAAAAGRVR
ncbi:MAG: O-antigen ligase family protein [Acidobacteriota bacterium]